MTGGEKFKEMRGQDIERIDPLQFFTFLEYIGKLEKTGGKNGTSNNQTVITSVRFSTLFIFFLQTGTKEVQVLYVDAFPYHHIYIYICFLLPVILASVYLNTLKHVKSQKNPGQPQTRGGTSPRHNACISMTLSEFRIANSRWRICSGKSY